MKRMIATIKQLVGDFMDFVKWHLPGSVAEWKTLEKHFNLTLDEIAMMESAISHKLLKEGVVFNEPKGEAYVVLNVSQVRKLLKIRRRIADR